MEIRGLNLVQREQLYLNGLSTPTPTINSSELRELIRKWRDIENLHIDESWKVRKKLFSNFNKIIEIHPKARVPVDELDRFISCILAIQDKSSQHKKSFTLFGRKNLSASVLHSYFKYVQDQIQQEFNKVHFRNLAPQTSERIIFDILGDFRASVLRELNDLLVFEYGCALSANLLRDPADSFDDFVNTVANTKEWLEYFFQQYPVVINYLYKRQGYLCQFLLEFVLRLESDYIKLVRHFNLNPNARITQVQGFKGDFHKKMRSVVQITFDSKDILYYKPRSLKTEVTFFEFLKKFSSKALPNLYTYKILERGSYGWCEHVDNMVCHSMDDVQTFYYNQGKLLSTCYFLGVTDIIYDNVIAYGARPSIIDLELIFSPTIPYNANFGFFDREIYYNRREAVTRTGILPRHTIGDPEREGINDSCLSKIRDQKLKITKWVKEGSQIKQDYDLASIHREDIHLPKYRGKHLSVSGYEESFIRGFRETYMFFAREKENVINFLSNLPGLETRVLIRPTSVYNKLVIEALSTHYLSDALEVEILFDNLWGMYDIQACPKEIIKSETLQLWDFDIPFFIAKSKSRHLYSYDGATLVKDYFEETGIQSAIRRINEANQKLMNEQLDIIKNSFIIFESYNPHKSSSRAVEFYFSDRGNSDVDLITNGESILQEAALSIGKYLLKKSKLSKNGRIYWSGIGQSAYENWNNLIIPPGLYTGTDGIALFLGQLYNYSHQEVFKTAAFSVLESNLETSSQIIKKQTTIRPLIVSAFTPPLSTIYVCESLGVQGIEYNVSDYQDWIRLNFMFDKNYDYVLGSIGIVTFLLNMFEKSKEGPYLQIAQELSDYIVASAVEDDESVYWNAHKFQKMSGFSHGAAAFAWTFFRLFSLTDNLKYYNIADKCINFENSLYRERENGWKYSGDGRKSNFHACWAHGSGGICLSRLLINELNLFDTNKYDEDISRSMKHLIDNGFSKFRNHTLSSGIMGNLEILNAAAKYKDDKDLQLRIYQRLIVILPQIRTRG